MDILTVFDEGCNYREVEYKFKIYTIYKADYRRFHEKYRVDEETGCWEWMASFNNGYSQFYLFNKEIRRGNIASFLMFKDKKIELNHYICHKCDNPKCVNPAHLWSGTNSDNQIDAIKKGRKIYKRGESHHLAILTEEIVKEIKLLYSNNFSPSEIYKKFPNYSKSTIKSVIYKNWKHIS